MENFTTPTRQTLDFSTNWNGKLDCSAFSTLRRSDRYRVGEEVSVFLKHKYIGSAECVAKSRVRVGAISLAMAYLDTGYDQIQTREILKKMYSDIDDDSIIFHYVFKRTSTVEVEEKRRQLALFV